MQDILYLDLKLKTFQGKNRANDLVVQWSHFYDILGYKYIRKKD